MNQKQEYALHVARFAERYNLSTEQVLKLINLARRAFKAGEFACNHPDPQHREQKTADAFEAYAKQLGFKGCDWPGLWPVLQDKDGRDEHGLPV